MKESGANSTPGNNNAYGTFAKVGLFLGPSVFILVLALPTPVDMPVAANRMAAVALLMAVWWVTQALPLAATALLPIVAFPLLGIMKSRAVAPQYADHNVFLFMGGFMVALAMEKWGLHRRIAAKTILLFGRSLRGMVLGFMAATAFLSMWISNTATTMLMLPIAIAALSRYENNDAKTSSDLGVALMLGIAYAASVGGIGTLIGTPPNIVLVGAAKRLLPGSPEIGFGQWMLIGVPLVMLFIPVMWLYIVRVAAPLPAEPRTADQQQLETPGPMNRGEIVTLVIFALAALGWILRKPVLSILFPAITDTTVAVAAALLLFVIPVDWAEKKFALDWKTVRRLPWGVLILFGGGFALAAGMQQSGLSDWLGERLALVTGGLPLPAAVILICVFMAALTELTSNTAITATMMPILAATSVGMGAPALLYMVPAAMAASCAFMLPVATPPNAIVFGSGRVPLSRMIRTGLLLEVVGVVLVTVVISTLGRWVFS